MAHPLPPTGLDVWVSAHLAHLTGHRLLDLTLQSAARHGVLGGWIFAATLFILWTKAIEKEDDRMRVRLVSVLLGVLLAGGLSEVAAKLIRWDPPRNNLALVRLYPRYWDPIDNPNSFPSQSTAIFAAVAVGAYTVRKRTGQALCLAVALLVALPRMYLGGHYLTDVVGGALIGALGVVVAIAGLEPRTVPALDHWGMRNGRTRIVYYACVFTVLWQIADEFREAIWVKWSISYFF